MERLKRATRRHVRIVHRPSGLLLAEGPTGWGITRFEGRFYVRRKYLRARGLTPNWIPGLCPYKGLYVWLDLRLPDGNVARSIGWYYWLPNPLLPFTAFRVALDGRHPDLLVAEGSNRERQDHDLDLSAVLRRNRGRPVTVTNPTATRTTADDSPDGSTR